MIDWGKVGGKRTASRDTYHAGAVFGQVIALANLGMIESQANGSSRDYRRTKGQEVVFLEYAFHVVGSSDGHQLGSLSNEKEPVQKRMPGGDGNLEFQVVENCGLHVENLLARKATVRNVDAVSHFGRVDLFVLAGNKERGDPNKLELGTIDLDKRKVAVQDVDAKVQGLWDKTELHVDFNEPINENGSHRSSEALLIMHVWMRTRFSLRKAQARQEV